MALREADTTREVVAANLRALKAAQQTTDQRIGAALGKSGAAINERMRGVTECSATDLKRFALYFGVPISRLFEDDDYRPTLPGGNERGNSDVGLPPIPCSGVIAGPAPELQEVA